MMKVVSEEQTKTKTKALIAPSRRSAPRDGISAVYVLMHFLAFNDDGTRSAHSAVAAMDDGCLILTGTSAEPHMQPARENESYKAMMTTTTTNGSGCTFYGCFDCWREGWPPSKELRGIARKSKYQYDGGRVRGKNKMVDKLWSVSLQGMSLPERSTEHCNMLKQLMRNRDSRMNLLGKSNLQLGLA